MESTCPYFARLLCIPEDILDPFLYLVSGFVRKRDRHNRPGSRCVIREFLEVFAEFIMIEKKSTLHFIAKLICYLELSVMSIVPVAVSEDMRKTIDENGSLTGPSPCKYQSRTFDRVNASSLLRIQMLIVFIKQPVF